MRAIMLLSITMITSGCANNQTDSATTAPITMAEPSTTTSTHHTAAIPDTQFIDCVSTPTIRPSTITFNCTMPEITLTHIHWESWTSHHATGTGTGSITGRELTVELSEPIIGVDGTPVFNQILIDGTKIIQ
ncbi:putative secreted protein [Corynebacterium kutscheri]|uniref:Secreted protein n=1 Tax=Corynebacterium kutscheri TaxID=35755 RepID=A0A0F6TDR7_9CORY|nr:hypothetical protein [Corynebacterium kutscheri]AKE41781.1 hypothetical protein UL82_08100 [Corynebacterium kutscheri]VEH09056.1 putative secreted protein [Corynebacterium kutscheri]VEH10107.1 putative secreted protein [Corynebacterium kutscheri]VEH80189.1 putative secreted protein [Corynebacterium kutscheri]